MFALALFGLYCLSHAEVRAQDNSTRKDSLQLQIDSLNSYVGLLVLRIETLESRLLELEERNQVLESKLKAQTPAIPSGADAGPTKSSGTESRQCSATTKKGTRCSRTTSDPSGRCWQHK